MLWWEVKHTSDGGEILGSWVCKAPNAWEAIKACAKNEDIEIPEFPEQGTP